MDAVQISQQTTDEYTINDAAEVFLSKLDDGIDDYENGEVIGSVKVGLSDGVYKGKVKAVTGRHAVFFKVTHETDNWTAPYFDTKSLFELLEFTFIK